MAKHLNLLERDYVIELDGHFTENSDPVYVSSQYQFGVDSFSPGGDHAQAIVCFRLYTNNTGIDPSTDHVRGAFKTNIFELESLSAFKSEAKWVKVTREEQGAEIKYA